MPLLNALGERRFVRQLRAVRRNRWLGYGVAVAVASFAVLLRWALDPVLSAVGVPYITFYPAILVAALFGGFRGGLATLVLCSLAAWYLFLPPYFSFELSPQQVFSLLLFLALGALDLVLVSLLNAALDRIVTQEANLRTLIDAAPNGIVVVDQDGAITLVNPSAEKMFGYTRQQLIGQSVEILVPNGSRTAHNKLRHTYMQAPVQRPMALGRDFQAQRKDGTTFPVEVDLAPISSATGTRVMATVIDISERNRAQERQRLLVGELRHRAQNILSVVQAIAHRTLSTCPTSEKSDLLGRFLALGRVNAMLADGNWEAATLREIIARELAPFSIRVRIIGCEIAVSASVAQNFALVIHELATNAAKYGALSTEAGQIVVEGKIELIDGESKFVFLWNEIGGPPVKQPERKGFGSSVLVHVARQFSSDVQISFNVEGLRYTLHANVSKIMATTGPASVF
jgi:PAS domain S-box-containing protein